MKSPQAAVLALVLACSSGSITVAHAEEGVRDTFSDTWVAVDGLGRRVPTAAEVGPPRPNKTVAIFYFLWLGRSGEDGPFDITKILQASPNAMSEPNNPLWGPKQYPHHWGESIFGYYRNDDPAVLRKHAQMLADAGVDAVFFDVTNQLTYPESWKALGATFDEMRKQGLRVPKIAFLTPFWAPKKVVRELYDQLYKPGLFPDLWFQWKGKPLILADPDLLRDVVLKRESHRTSVPLAAGEKLGTAFKVDAPFDSAAFSTPTWGEHGSSALLTLRRGSANGEVVATQRVEDVRDNAWSGVVLDAPAAAGDYYLEISEPKGRIGVWKNGKDEPNLRVSRFDDADRPLFSFFTFRRPQPDYFQGPTARAQWSWLEVYPQHAFPDEDGRPEQISVGIGQNAVDGKLGVLSHPRGHGRSFSNGVQPGPEGFDYTGKNFTEQWRRAHEVDPPLVFVTGWNEWIAGRFDEKFPLAGAGPVTFVDQFDREHSRDIEPMKGGHGDAFYYQLVSEVRRYKGARPVPAVASRPIAVDGRFDDWEGVAPEFRDTIGDPMHRDYPGWGRTLRYVDQSGRNDIIAAKASRDADRVCFLLQCAGPIRQTPDMGGPMLFLDVDSDPRTGWLGYDFVVGRTPGRRMIERNVDGRYQWADPQPVEAAMNADRLEIAVPASSLGLKPGAATIDFKWADAVAETGDWSDFTLHGDAAPNDRFNYRAVFGSGDGPSKSDR
ncbi:hypothetical protein [Paludisphaera rhizosphaerae]|uniref:hypothetical protein n=1 Tax=Paludisphaera rhizosphaerae TaxID=2711216 RepID=UPI0013EAFF39|nr:hypothetical protein [Paludisphaera rhizosphaerae]